MKRVTQILTASAFALAAQFTPAIADHHAGDEAGASLSLTVSGISRDGGYIMVGVFNSEDGWDSNSAVTGGRIEVTGDQVTIDFPGLEPGSYGLKLYHDVDGNGALDTNMMGIPTEPFAFSNNAMGRFGPASWDDAQFELAAGENGHSVSIR